MTETKRDELLRLADLVEAATDSDYRLGAEIQIAFQGFPEEYYWKRIGMRPRGSPEMDRVEFAASHFSDPTASLDAAMKLVPVCPMAGGDLYAVRLDSGFYGATAELWHECSVERFHGHGSGQHEALCRALVAAALRAQASVEEQR